MIKLKCIIRNDKNKIVKKEDFECDTMDEMRARVKYWDDVIPTNHNLIWSYSVSER